jgi:hypothetical protein
MKTDPRINAESYLAVLEKTLKEADDRIKSSEGNIAGIKNQKFQWYDGTREDELKASNAAWYAGTDLDAAMEKVREGKATAKQIALDKFNKYMIEETPEQIEGLEKSIVYASNRKKEIESKIGFLKNQMETKKNPEDICLPVITKQEKNLILGLGSSEFLDWVNIEPDIPWDAWHNVYGGGQRKPPIWKLLSSDNTENVYTDMKKRLDPEKGSEESRESKRNFLWEVYRAKQGWKDDPSFQNEVRQKFYDFMGEGYYTDKVRYESQPIDLGFPRGDCTRNSLTSVSISPEQRGGAYRLANTALKPVVIASDRNDPKEDERDISSWILSEEGAKSFKRPWKTLERFNSIIAGADDISADDPSKISNKFVSDKLVISDVFPDDPSKISNRSNRIISNTSFSPLDDISLVKTKTTNDLDNGILRIKETNTSDSTLALKKHKKHIIRIAKKHRIKTIKKISC